MRKKQKNRKTDNCVKKKPLFKLACYVVFLAAAVSAFFVFTDGEVSAERLLEFTPKDPLKAAGVLLILHAVKSITVFFPIVVLQIAAGHLLPPAAAFAVNLSGLFIILTLPYVIGRAIGMETVKKLASKYPKFSRLIDRQQKNSLFWCFILRAVNCLPGDLVTMYLGAAHVPYVKNLAGGILGILPGMIPATFMGSSITDPGSAAFWLSALFFVGSSAISVLVSWRYNKKHSVQKDD